MIFVILQTLMRTPIDLDGTGQPLEVALRWTQPVIPTLWELRHEASKVNQSLNNLAMWQDPVSNIKHTKWSRDVTQSPGPEFTLSTLQWVGGKHQVCEVA